MPRVLFKEAFNWHPKPNVTICHKAGKESLVTRRCANEAITAGKGMIALRLQMDQEYDAGRRSP